MRCGTIRLCGIHCSSSSKLISYLTDYTYHSLEDPSILQTNIHNHIFKHLFPLSFCKLCQCMRFLTSNSKIHFLKIYMQVYKLQKYRISKGMLWVNKIICLAYTNQCLMDKLFLQKSILMHQNMLFCPIDLQWLFKGWLSN